MTKRRHRWKIDSVFQRTPRDIWANFRERSIVGPRARNLKLVRRYQQCWMCHRHLVGTTLSSERTFCITCRAYWNRRGRLIGGAAFLIVWHVVRRVRNERMPGSLGSLPRDVAEYIGWFVAWGPLPPL